MENNWFEMDDDMHLMRRRVTTSCVLNSLNVEARSSSSSNSNSSSISSRHMRFRNPELRRFQDIAENSLFHNYCDFTKKPKSKFTSILREPMFQLPEKSMRTDSSDFQTEMGDLKKKIQSVQEENLKLQAVITDLTQVNKRWQNYNNDRQIYVQKLLNTIQDQQAQINEISERTLGSQKEDSCSNASMSSCEGNLETLKNTEQKLKERVELLEFQVKAHRDDWEAELNEKKQALQDKEKAEKKVMELLAELTTLKNTLSSDVEVKRSQFTCRYCGLSCQKEYFPAYSQVFRTAVHLPYSVNSSRERTVYILEDAIGFEEVNTKTVPDSDNSIDSSSNLNNLNSHQKPCSDSRQCDLWQIDEPGPSNQGHDSSYSRSSTVPLVNHHTIQSSCLSKNVTPVNSDQSLNEEVPLKYKQGLSTVTSFVQIPISKSLSAPEKNGDRFLLEPRKSVDSIKFSSVTPPLTLINHFESKDHDSMLEGTETQTMDIIKCPSCTATFPPKMHLKFLDHFESCQIVNKN
uniref:Uncharacterized protein n=2 Tax=Clastoptera arizonana TaxID=38151 RepID=A0A1B6DIQ2_9HEMI